MSARRFDDFETRLDDRSDSQDSSNDTCPTTKLQRRRRIEDLSEEKRLREELGDFDLV